MDSPRLVLQNGSIFDSISTEKVKENHRTALEMGVKIALGTDTPVGNEHGSSSTEIRFMVDNTGMTNAEAL
ncbi:MAG: hypothetical protein IH840_13845 [Candidatus Heimdallarchaeota archaeon]|nr:hypothetical protein [Candidatus Heimdallarchaeota archaeon]